MVTKQKMLKLSGHYCNRYGVGRTMHKGSTFDQYIITRGNNFPELIFNQNPKQDKNIRKRFFEVDAE